LTFKVSVKG